MSPVRGMKHCWEEFQNQIDHILSLLLEVSEGFSRLCSNLGSKLLSGTIGFFQLLSRCSTVLDSFLFLFLITFNKSSPCLILWIGLLCLSVKSVLVLCSCLFQDKIISLSSTEVWLSVLLCSFLYILLEINTLHCEVPFFRL